MEQPFDPVIPLLGIYLKKPKTLIQKNIGTPMFIAALFTIAKMWKQSKFLSTDDWIEWHKCTPECYSVIKNNEILPLVTTWMDLEGIMLNEIS